MMWQARTEVHSKWSLEASTRRLGTSLVLETMPIYPTSPLTPPPCPTCPRPILDRPRTSLTKSCQPLRPTLINTPFDALRSQITSIFSEVASTFNAAQLPLPAARTVQFCNNVDTSIVDDIGRPLVHIAETSQ